MRIDVTRRRMGHGVDLLAVALTFVAASLVQPAAQAATPIPAEQPFLWGVATSSYQVEGGIDCSNPSLPCNDYDVFNTEPFIHSRVVFNSSQAGPAVNLEPAGTADNVWNPSVYRRDFDNANLLGLNSFRLSLEWGRIEPQDDQWDQAALDHYRDMIDAMLARGIRPVVTINHFTLPRWVLEPANETFCFTTPFGGICHAKATDPDYLASLRGWESSQTVDEFVEFTKKVVSQFRGKVDYWLTINEPVGSQAVLGYIAGIWSPGFVGDGGRAKAALRNLILAHVGAYKAIKDCAGNPDCDNVDADGDGKPALVGFAHAMGPTVGSPPGFLGNQQANNDAAANFSYFLTDYFLNAVVKGEEDTNYLNSAPPERGKNVTVHEEWKDNLDFLGINYYRRFHIFQDGKLTFTGTGFVGGGTHNNLWGEPTPHELLNDLGWAMYPQGLYELIMRAKNEWNLPVLVTENGTPERQDRNRAPHLVAHLRQVGRAIEDGAQVLGYMHWTLIDNWELHEGYRPDAQFGLFHVDRSEKDANGNLVLHRQMTEGALAYQQVIAESRATSAIGAPTKAALDAASEKFGEVRADGGEVLPPSRTHGRFWEGNLDGKPIALYLGYVKATQRVTGMLLRKDLRQWRKVDLLVDSQGPFLREHWFDQAAGAMTSQDIRVSYANGSFTFPGTGNTASRIPGTGLWRWNAGHSPWGTNFFYVSKLEDRYAGKYLTFSSPGPQDEPTPVCGAGGCIPDVAGSHWKEFRQVDATAAGMRLDGTGREGEELFDVSLALSNPAVGSSIATTAAAKSGSFTTSKAYNVHDAHFHLTGYLSPAGDNTWIGERDGSTVSKFHFLETRGIWQEFPTNPAPIGGIGDQYQKENDPTSVMPLGSFDSHNGIRWEAGGRFYSIVNAPLGCLSPAVCGGTWTDIAGRVAARVSERFPAVVGDFPDQTIEANTASGANVTLAAPPALDLDGASLSYSWTGPFGTATGSNPGVFLGVGSHKVCVKVSKLLGVVERCATFVVRDTTPPAIQCASPDTLWHAADVRIACTASDVGSGLADPADASFSLATSVPADIETTNAATGTRSVCDKAGNCAQAGPIGGNRIDRKAPVIAITTPAAKQYAHSATLMLDYQVTDGGSGVNRFTPKLDGSTTLAGHGLADGQVIWLLTELRLGQHTFTIDAVDNVGNTRTASVVFIIIATPQSVKEDVNQFLASGAIKKAGLARSLLAKLNAAAAARARGDCATAANIYRAFIRQLDAQSGKGVDATAAAVMIADAQYLIEHCQPDGSTSLAVQVGPGPRLAPIDRICANVAARAWHTRGMSPHWRVISPADRPGAAGRECPGGAGRIRRPWPTGPAGARWSVDPQPRRIGASASSSRVTIRSHTARPSWSACQRAAARKRCGRAFGQYRRESGRGGCRGGWRR
jgi:beta-glucosidase/6-phospho-beta-glucosidase/beta-galactosidase